MTKRHQASRRKAYGRRQHEVRERTGRRHAVERDELGLVDWDERPAVDPIAFLDPRTPRLRFAVD